MISKTRRIILANEPRLLREMFKRVIRTIPDLEVVGEASSLEALEPLIEQTQAQWVVVSLIASGQMPESVERLLSQHPTLRILAVAEDGSQAMVKWLESREERLSGFSLNDLIAALQAKAPWRPTLPNLTYR
ncbi:MAG: hypothetical protein ACRDH2_11315 [Anaerolineales bacterium]